MHKPEAYSVLAAELEKWAQLPYADLVSHIGKPPISSVITLEQEVVEVDIQISWAKKKGSIQVAATASGPNWQRLERIEERIIVAPPKSGGNA